MSIGVLLLVLVVLARFFPNTLIPGVLFLLGVYAFIEALFHRNLPSLFAAWLFSSRYWLQPCSSFSSSYRCCQS